MSVGRFAPSPTGVLHLGNLRTAVLAWLFARSAWLSLPDAGRGPRRRAGPPGLRRGAARGPRRASAWTGTGRWWPSRLGLRSTRRRWRGFAMNGSCTSVIAPGPRSARRRVRLMGRCPRGRIPGRACGCRPRSSRRSGPRGGRRPCACGPMALPWRSTTGCSGRLRASSTTSWCGGATARSPTTSRSWSTTPTRASRRSCAGRTSRSRRRGSSGSRGRWGCRSRSYAHVPLVLGPDGSRLAKRHGAVTLRDVPVDARAGVDGGVAGVLGRRAAGVAGFVRSGSVAQR